jgi:phosphatidate cytidylyltransferase
MTAVGVGVPVEIWTVLGGAVAVLVVATLAGHVMQRRLGPGPGIENFRSRTTSWWVMVVVLAVAFGLGRPGTIVLFAAISAVALWEFLALTQKAGADRWAVAACFLVVLPLQYAFIWTGWYGMFAISIPVYAFLLLPIVQVLRGETQEFMARAAEIHWGLMIAVFCLSHVPALTTLSIPGFEGKSTLLALFLIVVVEASDVFQYIWGKLLGRHKIAPSLSPSKTWEGLAGGIVTATAIGAGLSWLTPFPVAFAALLTVLVTLLGFAGGLVMSAMKRDRGVKDWGSVIPGHGGILDRVDSIVFAAPIYFHLIRHYWGH